MPSRAAGGKPLGALAEAARVRLDCRMADKTIKGIFAGIVTFGAAAFFLGLSSHVDAAGVFGAAWLAALYVGRQPFRCLERAPYGSPRGVWGPLPHMPLGSGRRRTKAVLPARWS